ncbi:MAG: family 20 glycosylhydrolase [Planctomycetota bacterium]
MVRTLAWFVVLLAVPGVADASRLPLVPYPKVVTLGSGKDLPLVGDLAANVPPDWTSHVEVFGRQLGRLTQGRVRLRVDSGIAATINIRRVDSLSADEYVLDVTPGGIAIEASTLKGLTHATATLLQLVGGDASLRLPPVRIEDSPSVSYRNFMIDMGRNPHSLELLKETVDLLWFYKVDSLQLHLTDDQRFAWPSTAYPKLWDGLISLEQFRELELYAKARGVTVIPELEVPGHSSRLRSVYPEVFGQSATELATSATALNGIETILDELMDVFSSPYIHIGGDEAYGVPVAAQRDLINRLHGYLKSKGRQTIVWEGPDAGEGNNKVNTEVIHINWRTIAYPPDRMLRDGYRVVNAAWDPLYIVDHYPRINFTMCSPRRIFETLQLNRFKHVNPGIPTFSRPIVVEPSDRLIGFCMPWWEGREENFFGQNVPRLIPFAEVSWAGEDERDFQAFELRAKATEITRRHCFYPVTIQALNLVIPGDGVFHHKTELRMKLSESLKDAEIRYTLNGQLPRADSSLYSGPVTINDSAIVRAAAFVGGHSLGHASRLKLTRVTPTKNLALGKPVVSTAPSASPFSVERLTDGGTENLGFYLGYSAEPEPIRITIDLESVLPVDRIVVHAYSISNSAEQYAVEVSADGETFERVGRYRERPDNPVRPRPGSAVPVEHAFAARDVRYVRIVTNGNKGYVFDSFSKLVEVQVFGPDAL